MVKTLINSIFAFLGKIIDLILSPLDFPVVPPGLVDAVDTLFNYLSQGMRIVNFVCPIDKIKPALVCFVRIFTVKHSYNVIMWILRKIPFFGIN